MRSIFVNYRRSDSEGEAGRLFDDLVLRFSSESIFMDVAAIEPGRDFRKAIDQSVATCSVLLALIGQEWLDSKDALGNRRLDDANDFVRIELASALRRDIPVVPVLVRSARMPRVDQLPDDLKELAYRNAVELTHARWKSDVQVLMQALRPYLGVAREDAPAAVVSDAEKGTAIREEQVSGARAPSPTVATVAASSPFDAQTIERVSKQLAAYIGPIAELVVNRAAKRCRTLKDLYEVTAQEIESDSDRAKFLSFSRS